MDKVIKLNTPPEGSIIAEDFGQIDYCDSYIIATETEETIDSITVEAFKSPSWVEKLMVVRNSIVRVFGLKTDKEKAQYKTDYYPPGSTIEYFTVLKRNDNEIVMAENDKHLNFRTSVYIEKEKSRIYLTTIVHFNNAGGRLYFLPVKPFHRFIVKSTMKKLHRALTQSASK